MKKKKKKKTFYQMKSLGSAENLSIHDSKMNKQEQTDKKKNKKYKKIKERNGEKWKSIQSTIHFCHK